MAEKKEPSISSANERLQLWLSFFKFCIAVFFICVTIIEISKHDSRTKLKVAQLYSDGGEKENGAAAADKARAKAKAAAEDALKK